MILLKKLGGGNMNEKEIKNLLESYNLICAEIHQLNQEIIELAETIAAQRDLSAITYSDTPKGSIISDSTYLKAQKVIDVYQMQVDKTEKRIEVLFNKKNQIEALLVPLSDLEREIIKLKYFKKYRWEMVAASVHYSRRQCINVSDRIFKTLINDVNTSQKVLE